MQVYDVKVFDRGDKIVIAVDFGNGIQYMDPQMDFCMEFLENDVEKIQKIMELLQMEDYFVIDNLDTKDVDNRPTLVLKYRTLAVKEKMKNLCLQNEVELFNADIPEELQWMLKHNHVPANFLKKLLMFDIECDPTGFNFWASEEDVDKYKNRIYAIGTIDINGNEKFFIDEDEEILIKKFYSYTQHYTAITGWNSKNFDIPYLEGRCKKLGIQLDWQQIPHIDMMKVYQKWRDETKELGEVVYKGLDKAASEWLDAGKIDVGGPAGIKRMWDEKNWLGMEIYCMNDVRIMYDLYRELKGIRDVMDIEASKVELGYLKPNKRYVSAFVDNSFTRLAFDMGLSVPQMGLWQHRDADEVSTIGAGGFVPEPKKGLHFNVVSIDFYSLYPTIYMTHNSGVNTVDWNNEFTDSIKTDELSFKTEPRGLNALFMEWLLKTRKKYRDGRDEFEKGTPEYENMDIKQKAFKAILVSANGVLEEKKFRYKNQAIYNSTTKTGQTYLRFLKEAGESLGWEMIGGDTDGLHFLTPYESVEEIVEYLEEAEKHIQDYVKEKAMERWKLKEEYYEILPRCEQVSSHFYYIAKKSYVRRIVWDDGKYLNKPRFDAKGMPGVKYNTLPLLKEILKNIFKEVVFTVDAGADYVRLAVDYLLKVRDDLFSGRRDEWLTFSQRVDKLGGRLPHDRAAVELAKRGLFEPAMIISFIRRANGDIVLPEHEEDYRIDYKTYNYYWTGTVAKWIKELLPEVAGDRSLGFRMAAPTKKLDW